MPGSLDSRVTEKIDQFGLKYHDPKVTVNIEIVEGFTQRYHEQDLFHTPPSIGKSIGLRGSSSPGASGGYVKLAKSGKADKIRALTCHHVVAWGHQGSGNFLCSKALLN